MGLFSKAEITILKESSDAKTYLEKLEQILPQASGQLKSRIQKEITLTKAGIAGEENILFELKNSGVNMYVLHDLYIETADGRGAQIDYIIVTSCAIYIIECKNLFGNIEIDSKGNFIRTLELGGHKIREGIYSPITQNERHMTVLNDRKKEDLGFFGKLSSQMEFDKWYRSVVVLANPKTVVNDRYAKKEIKEQVIRADQLINLIRNTNAETSLLSRLSKSDMQSIAQSLLAMNIEERKDYFAKYEELLHELAIENSVKEAPIQTTESSAIPTVTASDQQNATSESKLICPKCGSSLVLRTAKKGTNSGNQFYGCSSFPKCHFIMNIK